MVQRTRASTYVVEQWPLLLFFCDKFVKKIICVHNSDFIIRVVDPTMSVKFCNPKIHLISGRCVVRIRYNKRWPY